MRLSDKRCAADPVGAPAGRAIDVSPNGTSEQEFAQVLAAIVGTEQVSVDSNFFDDLGADSMVMARFCARVRKHPNLPSVSMKEVYKHPTIRSLAAAATEAPSAPLAAPTPAPTASTPVGTAQYLLCGLLQFLSMFGYLFVLSSILVQGFHFMNAGANLWEVYVRSLLAGGVQLVVVCTLPILLKWMLIGRWRPGQIRIWSLGYVRFWFVKTLVQLNPVVVFAGTPIYSLYLRALGAKIGQDTLIFSLHVPACTDLLTIGDRAIVLKESFFNCYRAHDGLIQKGTVKLGKDSFVGEMTVLDIETSLGDGAQLGHSSSLYTGQSIPDGERRCGSPARQRTDVDYRAVEPASVGIVRKVAYSIVELITAVFVLGPMVTIVAALIGELATHPGVEDLESRSMLNWATLGDAAVTSLVLFFAVVLFGLAFVLTVPRLLNLAIKPDTVYRLYGFRYWAHRTIERVTNNMFFIRLFGDSSYIVHYLSWLGYDLSPVLQTGSNFGSNLKHITPFLVTVGRGTMVADVLSVVNAEYSSTSFRVSRVTIGRDNFLGNHVAYPSQGKTGDNCLLGSKVMVPVDGEVREGIGLLGSPSFEIPRTVLRDSKYEIPEEERLRRLARKNRHNLVTMGLFLLQHWSYTCLVILITTAGTAFYASVGAATVITLGIVAALLVRIFYFSLIEHASRLFRSLEPQHVSIYDPYFWFHERYWKLMASPNEFRMLAGTAFMGPIWRLLGVRLGKRLFDDGCHIAEATMVTIGDDCTLNVWSSIQPHSQEDGGFKSDRIKIGARCTLGVGGWIHYGVTVGEGAQLAPDTFVMKGEEVPPYARWGENPAREVLERPGAEGAIATAVPHGQPTRRRARLKGGQVA